MVYNSYYFYFFSPLLSFEGIWEFFVIIGHNPYVDCGWYWVVKKNTTLNEEWSGVEQMDRWWSRDNIDLNPLTGLFIVFKGINAPHSVTTIKPYQMPIGNGSFAKRYMCHAVPERQIYIIHRAILIRNAFNPCSCPANRCLLQQQKKTPTITTKKPSYFLKFYIKTPKVK